LCGDKNFKNIVIMLELRYNLMEVVIHAYT